MFRPLQKSIFIAMLLAVCIAAGWQSDARADIAYRLRFSPAGPLNVAANSTQSLDIFLDETVTGADTNLIGSTFNGNIVGVFFGDIRATATGTGVTNVVATPNSGEFDISGSDVTQNPVFFLQHAVLANAPATGSIVGSTRSVSLGSLTFDVGASGSTTLSLRDFDLGGLSDDIIIGDGFGGVSVILDNAANMTYGSITLNINAVPEPSTFAMLGVAGGIAGVVAWRRRRKTIQA